MFSSGFMYFIVLLQAYDGRRVIGGVMYKYNACISYICMYMVSVPCSFISKSQTIIMQLTIRDITDYIMSLNYCRRRRFMLSIYGRKFIYEHYFCVSTLLAHSYPGHGIECSIRSATANWSRFILYGNPKRNNTLHIRF